jgi:hypothetical protein
LVSAMRQNLALCAPPHSGLCMGEGYNVQLFLRLASEPARSLEMQQAQWNIDTRPQGKVIHSAFVSWLHNISNPLLGPPWTATIEIPRSGWILKERPLVTLRQGENDADLRLAINAMAPEELLFFSSLPIAPAFGALDPTTARFGSNSFQYGTVIMGQQDVKVYGIFRHGLGFSSCCSPNVHLHWNATSGLMEYRAVRNIPVGEPLSISFDVGGLLLPRNERRTRLWQRRNIDCTCFVCTSPDVRNSDLRRKFVAPIVQTKQQDVRMVSFDMTDCTKKVMLIVTLDSQCSTSLARGTSVSFRRYAVL